MRAFATALALLLTGCTTVPVSVGALGLCVGVCRFEIDVAQPVAQSAAEKIGGGLAGLAADYFAKTKTK
jgi:starvation-inducible outer membrane lipoprotein